MAKWQLWRWSPGSGSGRWLVVDEGTQAEAETAAARRTNAAAEYGASGVVFVALPHGEEPGWLPVMTTGPVPEGVVKIRIHVHYRPARCEAEDVIEVPRADWESWAQHTRDDHVREEVKRLIWERVSDGWEVIDEPGQGEQPCAS